MYVPIVCTLTNFLHQNQNLLSSLYIQLTLWEAAWRKLETFAWNGVNNWYNLSVFSSVSNYLFIYLFIVIGMDCEIKDIGTTESANIPCVSVWLICATAATSYHQKMFQKISILKKAFLHSSCSALVIKKFKKYLWRNSI